MLNLKKVIALVCVFALALSTVAFGATYTDVAEDSAYYEAVETLNKLDIVTGYEDGTYKPEAGVTRAEMAALIARIQGYGETAKGSANTGFADVPASHWASGYIANAAGMGIINGYGNGTFGPEDPVLYEQAVKMIMATLGYTPFAEKNGGYPTGYLAAAQRYDVSLAVANAAVGATANRGTVAQLLANALDTPLMVQSKWNTNGEVEYEIADGKENAYKTLMSENLGYVKIRGIVTENTTTVLGATKEINTDDAATVVIDVKDNFDTNNKKFLFDEDGVYDGVKTFLVADTDAEAYLGQSVIAYVKAVNNDYAIVSIAVDTNRNNVLEIGLDQYVGADDEELKYFKADADNATKVALQDGLKVVYNFAGDYDVDDLDALILDGASTCLYGGTLKLIDNDDKKGYNVAIVELAATGVVDEVDDEVIVLKEEVEKFGISEIEVDEDDETTIVKVLKDGEEIAISELAEYDVLSVITANGNVIVAEVISNQVVGAITSRKASSTSSAGYAYKIGDAWYDIAESAYGADALAVGDGGTFFIDKYGKVAAFNEDAALATGVAANFGYIYAVKADENEFGSAGFTLQAQLVTADGVEIVDFKKNAKINGVAVDASACETKAEAEALADGLAGEVVKYTKNSAGALNTVEVADYDDKFVASDLTTGAGKEYDAEDIKLGDDYVDADSIVFVIADEAADCKITTLADLEDKNEYTVLASYATDKAEYSNIIVLDATGFVTAGATSALAVITAAGESSNEDGEAVYDLSFFMNDEEVSALTTTDVVGDLPTVGDVVKVKLNAAGVVTSLVKVFDFTEDIRTAAGLMGAVDGEYEAGADEAIAGGKVEAYNKSRAVAKIDGKDYKLTQAKNTYVIDFTTKGVKVANTGSYKYIAKIYEDGAAGSYDLLKNDEIVAENVDVEDAKAYADYVYVRTYDKKVVDVVIVRGIDKAK